MLISKAEVGCLKQKSRNKWLNLGDHKNSCFHSLVNVRRSKISLKCLLDSIGRPISNQAVDDYLLSRTIRVIQCSE
jgi:hypothetical protein